jgi:hypothetical protein
MNRLHEKGFIGNPVGKAKSVVMTPVRCRKAKELFEKLFVKHRIEKKRRRTSRCMPKKRVNIPQGMVTLFS